MQEFVKRAPEVLEQILKDTGAGEKLKKFQPDGGRYFVHFVMK